MLQAARSGERIDEPGEKILATCDLVERHELVRLMRLVDIAGATQPRFLRLTAKFNVRGGIYTTVVVERRGCRVLTPATKAWIEL